MRQTTIALQLELRGRDYFAEISDKVSPSFLLPTRSHRPTPSLKLASKPTVTSSGQLYSLRAQDGHLLGFGRKPTPALQVETTLHVFAVKPGEIHPEEPSFVIICWILVTQNAPRQHVDPQPVVMLNDPVHEKPEDDNTL